MNNYIRQKHNIPVGLLMDSDTNAQANTAPNLGLLDDAAAQVVRRNKIRGLAYMAPKDLMNAIAARPVFAFRDTNGRLYDSTLYHSRGLAVQDLGRILQENLKTLPPDEAKAWGAVSTPPRAELGPDGQAKSIMDQITALGTGVSKIQVPLIAQPKDSSVGHAMLAIVDKANGRIEFYESNGEWEYWIKDPDVQRQIGAIKKATGITKVENVVATQHQGLDYREDANCGVYACTFAKKRAAGASADDLGKLEAGKISIFRERADLQKTMEQFRLLPLFERGTEIISDEEMKAISLSDFANARDIKPLESVSREDFLLDYELALRRLFQNQTYVKLARLSELRDAFTQIHSDWRSSDNYDIAAVERIYGKEIGADPKLQTSLTRMKNSIAQINTGSEKEIYGARMNLSGYAGDLFEDLTTQLEESLRQSAPQGALTKEEKQKAAGEIKLSPEEEQAVKENVESLKNSLDKADQQQSAFEAKEKKTKAAYGTVIAVALGGVGYAIHTAVTGSFSLADASSSNP